MTMIKANTNAVVVKYSSMGTIRISPSLGSFKLTSKISGNRVDLRFTPAEGSAQNVFSLKGTAQKGLFPPFATKNFRYRKGHWYRAIEVLLEKTADGGYTGHFFATPEYYMKYRSNSSIKADKGRSMDVLWRIEDDA